jgi:hypothetical protein
MQPVSFPSVRGCRNAHRPHADIRENLTLVWSGASLRVGRQAREKRSVHLINCACILMHYKTGNCLENGQLHLLPINDPYTSRVPRPASQLTKPSPCVLSTPRVHGKFDTHGELERKVSVRLAPQADANSPEEPLSAVGNHGTRL